MTEARPISIRHYTAADARLLAELVHDSIHGIAAAHYSAQQLQAWSPQPIDYGFWQQRLDRTRPYVAEIEGRPVGLMSLEDDGHIDLAFVHRDVQGRGIAHALLEHVQQRARRAGIRVLYVEASQAARGFFEKQGFVIHKSNDIEKNGQQLINWSMKKTIDAVPNRN